MFGRLDPEVIHRNRCLPGARSRLFHRNVHFYTLGTRYLHRKRIEGGTPVYLCARTRVHYVWPARPRDYSSKSMPAGRQVPALSPKCPFSTLGTRYLHRKRIEGGTPVYLCAHTRVHYVWPARTRDSTSKSMPAGRQVSALSPKSWLMLRAIYIYII